MSKHRHGQVEVNGEGGVGGNTRGSSNNNDRANSNTANTDRSVNRQNRDSTAFLSDLNLGPYPEIVTEALHQMSQTFTAVKILNESYSKHLDEIQKIPQIQHRHIELQTLVREKDEKIKQHKDAILILSNMNGEKEEEFAQERADIEQERTVLEAEKEDFGQQMVKAENRAKTKDAEQQMRHEKELQKLKADQEKELKKRRVELEHEMKSWEDKNKKTLTDLQTDNKKLLEKLREQKKQNDDQEQKLKTAKESYGDLIRIKNSFKDDAQNLETKLKMIENEFAFESQPAEFYEQRFFEVSEAIERISFRFFEELSNIKPQTIRATLIAADPGFASIPISDSVESQNLRIAIAQHVMSSALCKIIWQPFSSEKTLHHPDYVSFLDDLSAGVVRSSQASNSSGRLAKLWKAYTMRSLQSLPATPPSTPKSTPRGTHPLLPPSLSRADTVVEEVFSLLSVLLPSSEKAALRKELYGLANLAISVWTHAQTDELKLSVDSPLQPEKRNDWRHPVFDPPSPSDDKTAAVISKERSSIWVLFPRVMAQKVLDPDKPPASLPGSFPVSEQEVRTTSICIHAGTGLPEWSALVIKGREEEEETQRIYEEEKERMQKNVDARTKKSGGHSRSGSMAEAGSVGLKSGPSSPIKEWSKGALQSAVEE